jgi:hypothetical protein
MIQVKERSLIVVKNADGFRIEIDNPSHEISSDRTRASGNYYRFV